MDQRTGAGTRQVAPQLEEHPNSCGFFFSQFGCVNKSGSVRRVFFIGDLPGGAQQNRKKGRAGSSNCTIAPN